MVAAGHFPGGQVESVLVTRARRRAPSTRADVGRGQPRELRSRASGLRGVTGVSAPQWNAAHDAALRRRPPRGLGRRRRRGPGRDGRRRPRRIPAWTSARPVTSRSTTPSTTASPRTCHSAEGISLPDHHPADAAGLRRADRRRRAGAARGHLGGGHDGHRRAAVAPDPRRADGDQHDRADRDGGRRRLLAVLPQARARGTRQGPHHPRRRRDRGGHVGTLDPGVGRGRDRLDGRAVHRRRRDLRLPRRGRDRRRRGGGHRVGHRAAGPAGQARPLVGPPAGPAAVAGQPSDRARAASAAASWRPSYAVRSRRSCRADRPGAAGRSRRWA